MSFTARDVLWSVNVTLQDGGNRRWTLEELLVYLNDGLKEIAFFKPSAVSSTVRLALSEGTYQELADGHAMLRVIRNITSADGVTPRVSGPTVTPIDGAILDAQFPNWHATGSVPFAATVTHVVYDEQNPRAFYVFPGNDGTGAIEAVIAQPPTPVAVPASPLDIDSYTATVDLPDLYENVLRQYVLHRAFEKDAAVPGAAQRSASHRAAFETALGVKAQTEAATNVNTEG